MSAVMAKTKIYEIVSNAQFSRTSASARNTV